MLVLANLGADSVGLALQTDQETVQRLGLAWQRSQQSHQTGLSTELPHQADDDLVDCGVLTCGQSGG